MNGFPEILALLGLVLIAVAGLYTASWLLCVSRIPLSAAPFTGGSPPVEHAVSRYHVRWYTVTMLFLSFDMEMIFMYAWTRVVTVMGPSAVVEMFAFLSVLLAGVVYAWREGALRWA